MENFRHFSSSFPSTAISLAILIGTAELTVFGARGLTNPSGFLQGFGLPVLYKSSTSTRLIEPDASKDESSAEIHPAQRALVEALAARNIQNGVLILTFACFVRDRRALGVAVTAGLVTTIADTLVVWRYGTPKAVYGHLVGIGNCLGIGGSLLLLE